jgi:hypothetical protein
MLTEIQFSLGNTDCESCCQEKYYLKYTLVNKVVGKESGSFLVCFGVGGG